MKPYINNELRNSPCKAITPKGRAQLAFLDFVFGLFAVFYGKKWKCTLKNFEEDPFYFTWKDSLYLGYKYYFRIPEQTLNHKDTKSRWLSGFHEVHKGNNLSLSESLVPSWLEKKDNVTISLGGDLMPYETINKKTCENLWDEFPAVAERESCGEFFFSSDIVFANLETPIDNSKPVSLVPEVMLNDMHFNGNEEMFEIFSGNGKYKGYDVLSVANNHSLDQGKEGLIKTLDFLQEKNILTCGAARNENEVNDFPIIERNGISFAFLAYTFSLNKFSCGDEPWLCNHLRLNKPGEDFSFITQQTKIARERNADVVILSLHMGNAYQLYPDKHIIENTRRIARETEADVLVCNHAHNPQPYENYEWMNEEQLAPSIRGRTKNALIFYALGDFVAYDIYKLAQQTLMVKLHCKKENGKVEIEPEVKLVKMRAEGRNKIKGLKFEF